MSNETEALLLKAVLEEYATPDPKIVGTIPRNGINLSYVSHSEITRILITVDANWSWEPIEWVNGRPAIHIENGMATMWGKMTLLGKPMFCVGSARSDKPDYEKELIGDLLRNGSMRYGIALNLWSKTETPTANYQKPASRPITDRAITDAFPGSTVVTNQNTGNTGGATKAMPARQASAGNPVSDKQIFLINKLSKEQGVNLLTFAAEIIGREINAINILNSREASQIIDRLMNPVREEIRMPVALDLSEEEPF